MMFEFEWLIVFLRCGLQLVVSENRPHTGRCILGVPLRLPPGTFATVAVMIKLFSVAIVAGLIIAGSSQRLLNATKFIWPIAQPCDYPTHIQCWTDWFDRDDPSGTGDWETFSDLRKQYPEKLCPKPVDIEARTLSGLSVAATGDVIYKNDPAVGFICKNSDQSSRMCNDYKVRFSCHPPFCGGICWTKWYDRDNPSGTGDWELLSNLMAENPGEIWYYPMYIEVVTTDTLTPAVSTGETFHIFSPTQGFVCRRTDQTSGMCRDYKVRFGFPCGT